MLCEGVIITAWRLTGLMTSKKEVTLSYYKGLVYLNMEVLMREREWVIGRLNRSIPGSCFELNLGWVCSRILYLN